jgi:Ca2+-binding RTX toxin-like protein
MVVFSIGNGITLNMGSQSLENYQINPTNADSLDFSVNELFEKFSTVATVIGDVGVTYSDTQIIATVDGIGIQVDGAGFEGFGSSDLLFNDFKLTNSGHLVFSLGWAPSLNFTPFYNAVMASGGDLAAIETAAEDLIGNLVNVGWKINDGSASNTINGTSKADILNGNGGNDKLGGLLGADKLDGGAGHDTMTGGGGADKFVFDANPVAANSDHIKDFVHGTDKIQFDNADFKTIGANGALSSDAFFAGTAAHDASDRIIYTKATGSLYYDPDGNGSAAKVLIAVLDGSTHPTVSASDLQVI